MIKSVSFSNFYSFNDEQKISFTTKNKSSYDYTKPSVKGEQITKVAGFYGGNASGKTNIVRVFGFLRYVICTPTRDDLDNNGIGIAYKSFFQQDKETKIVVEFKISGSDFTYEIRLKEKDIIYERLSIKKGSEVSSNVFIRRLNKISVLSDTYFKNLSKNDKSFRDIRSDISLIAYIKSSKSINIINIVYIYFASLLTNINEIGQRGLKSHKELALELYANDNSLKEEMELFIKNFDLGLNGFSITKEHGEDKKYTIFGIHKTRFLDKRIPLEYESAGTRSLLFLLSHILFALKTESVLILDEIETGFHPEAITKLLTYFVDRNEKSNAQLIFTSHALETMQKREMQQIFLVEKNEFGESQVYRLNEIKGIRSDENFLSKYKTGAYGAKPQIKV